MKQRFATLGALPALLLVSACGQETAPGRTTSPTPQRYEVQATVLENAKHGPQLCHAMTASMPPQCGGPDVVDWDWAAVTSESEGDVMWGSYVLTGTWDGTRFSLTEPAKPGDNGGVTERPSEEPDFTPPCRPPGGGRRAVEPSKASAPDYSRALQQAEKESEFAGGWVNGESPTVLVMRFTRDLPGHEREIRKTWGGALCLTTAKHSQADLEKVQEQVTKKVPNVLTSGYGPVENAVTVKVVLATENLQQDMDRRFGAGVVKLESWLKPVDQGVFEK